MSLTLTPEAATLPSDWDTLSSQDSLFLLEAMLGGSDRAVVVLEAPSDDSAAAQVLWANPAASALAGERVKAGECPTFWLGLLAIPDEQERSWGALMRGEVVHCSSSISCARRLFQVTLVPLSSCPAVVRFAAILEDKTEQARARQEMQDLMTRAHCLIWHAKVTSTNGDFQWEFEISNLEAALQWLPIAHCVGDSLVHSWYMARPQGESARINETSRTAILSGEASYHQEFQVRLANGQLRQLAETVQIEPLEPGCWRLTGVCTDITERKQEQETLNEIITHVQCLVWDAVVEDRNGFRDWDLQVFNEAAAQRWLSVRQEPGQSFTDAWFASRYPEDFAACRRLSDQALLTGQAGYCQEFRVCSADGEIHWLAEDVQIKALDPGRWHLMGICMDITERKKLEEERERLLAQALDQADRDPLTGLLNHRAFHAHLGREADRAVCEGSVLGVAVIDLDNFKFFNDAYGHLSGDDVLRQVASALRDACRSAEILARFGGDEFAVLMPGATPVDVGHLATRLVSCLDDVRYRPPGANSDIPLSLSVGMAVFPEDAATPLAVLHLADERLLRVKSGDRGNGAQAERLRARLASGMEGFSMLDALVVAVDNKDRYTRSHSEDVLFYCLQIAEALVLAADETHALEVAALLHDVGKIGIPDQILRKPGQLTEAEYHAMKQHPVMGAAIVGAVPGLEATLGAVRHHHERWDGQGYPDALAGEQTPLAARIMAVADAYSAMTTDRPYRKGMSPEKARAELSEGAGTQWDPGCVHAFLTAQRRLSCLKGGLPLLMPKWA